MVESKVAAIALISMAHVLNSAISGNPSVIRSHICCYLLSSGGCNRLSYIVDTSPSCDGSNRYVYECECLHFVYTPQLDWQGASDECRKLNSELVTIR